MLQFGFSRESLPYANRVCLLSIHSFPCCLWTLSQEAVVPALLQWLLGPHLSNFDQLFSRLVVLLSAFATWASIYRSTWATPGAWVHCPNSPSLGVCTVSCTNLFEGSVGSLEVFTDWAQEVVMVMDGKALTESSSLSRTHLGQLVLQNSVASNICTFTVHRCATEFCSQNMLFFKPIHWKYILM